MIDSEEQFFEVISGYYSAVAAERIPQDLLSELSRAVSDHYYGQYTRFFNQYPKSRKRYSSFNFKDIEHPATTEIVVRFFTKECPEKYLEYSAVALNITEAEVMEFEQWLNDYRRIFS